MLTEVWRKSTRSQDTNCVEVAYIGDRVRVRDTKDQDCLELAVAPAQWLEFVAGIKAGEFDLD